MARLARAVVPGYPHHVTQRGVRGMDLFRDDADRDEYLRLLREQSERFKVKFLAWCLMSNHVHLVAVPEKERSLALAVGEAHRRYTRMVNFREEVRGHLFQERFHSCVLDERHLLAAARYVELNPVRAAIVQRPEDWPWSSARAHLGEAQHDPLVADRTLLNLVPDAAGWRTLLGEQDAEAEGHLRVATRTGRPAGEGRFLSKLEKLTGRELARRRPGRRPKPRKGGRRQNE
jgi:putative transposase